jgi:hypothetical protein
MTLNNAVATLAQEVVNRMGRMGMMEEIQPILLLSFPFSPSCSTLFGFSRRVSAAAGNGAGESANLSNSCCPNAFFRMTAVDRPSRAHHWW